MLVCTWIGICVAVDLLAILHVASEVEREVLLPVDVGIVRRKGEEGIVERIYVCSHAEVSSPGNKSLHANNYRLI